MMNGAQPEAAGHGRGDIVSRLPWRVGRTEGNGWMAWQLRSYECPEAVIGVFLPCMMREALEFSFSGLCLGCVSYTK